MTVITSSIIDATSIMQNLFQAKTHSFSRENSIESSPRSLAKSSPRAIAKELVKGDKRSKANRSRGRGEDKQPSKPVIIFVNVEMK